MEKPYILCIDDENSVLRVLKDQIKGFQFDDIIVGDSYCIELLESGHEAITYYDELISENKYVALVICDYIMPDLKGDMVLSHIHNINSNTFGCLLTGQATLEGIENAVNCANIYKYISKPWKKEELFNCVKAVHKNILKQKKDTLLKQATDELENRINQKIYDIEKLKSQSIPATFDENKTNEIFETVKADETTSLRYQSSKSFAESLTYIKKGFELLSYFKENIKVNISEKNIDLEACIEGFDEHFCNISKSIDQLIYSFETKKTARRDDSLKSHNEIYSATIRIKNDMLESINELSFKMHDLEKKFKKDPKKIIAWEDEKIFIFNTDEVIYFYSEGRNIFAKTKKGSYRVREVMYKLEKELYDYNFYRCHKSYLININYIVKIEPWIGYDTYMSTLEGCETSIPISKKYISEIKRVLGI